MIQRTHFEVGQTALTIVCDRSFLKTVEDAVFEARFIIESKISEDPFFGTTFEPYEPSEEDDPLIVRMCQSSKKAGVGPMAGVAGAVADHAVRKAVKKGCGHIIVENGGDISMLISKPVLIGVFAADEKFKNIAFKIHPTGRITGICSSSGKIGPSVSFGKSGICTVFSEDTILADECATAFGNMIKEGTQQEMSSSAEAICSIDGVNGCVCAYEGLIAICGNVPELTEADVSDDLITSIML